MEDSCYQDFPVSLYKQHIALARFLPTTKRVR